MNELIQVLIVDDHASMRNLFEREFVPENGFVVTGSIGEASDALAVCNASNPDLVVMDVCTENGASGLDAAEKIVKNFPNTKIIVTSGFDEVTYMPRAKKIGAHAFVHKINSAKYYRETARRVMAGECVFPEPMTIAPRQGEAPFTEREMEVLRLMCKCMSHREIADELFISPKTVNRHVENMRAKTGTKSAMGLTTYVLSNGWINPNY